MRPLPMLGPDRKPSQGGGQSGTGRRGHQYDSVQPQMFQLSSEDGQCLDSSQGPVPSRPAQNICHLWVGTNTSPPGHPHLHVGPGGPPGETCCSSCARLRSTGRETLMSVGSGFTGNAGFSIPAHLLFPFKKHLDAENNKRLIVRFGIVSPILAIAVWRSAASWS